MKYYVYETGITKTVYSESLSDILKCFDNRRNADDRGKYLSVGIMLNENSSFDVAGVDKENIYLIIDYKNIANKQDDKLCNEINKVVNNIVDKYNIDLQFTSSKLLGGWCLIPLERPTIKFSYMDDKVPLLDGNFNIKSCINEICIKGKGYVPYKEFVKLTYSNKASSVKPIITMINVSYINLTGSIGQTDLRPAEYLQFIEPYSKEYKLTMFDNNINKYVTYASFDDKKEAIRMSFDIGVPYLKEQKADTAIFDSKANLVFRTELYDKLGISTRGVAEEEFDIDFSKGVKPYPNGRLYAENLDDYYTHSDYYSGKSDIKPECSYNECFSNIKQKIR